MPHTYSGFFFPNMRPMLFLFLFFSFSGEDTSFHSSEGQGQRAGEGNGHVNATQFTESVCYGQSELKRYNKHIQRSLNDHAVS